MPEVNNLARRLWVLLTERPARYDISELKAELRASKSAIANALATLEGHGLISITQED